MKAISEQHLARIGRIFSARSNRTPATIAKLCGGNHSYFFERLEVGHTVTYKKARNVLQWFSNHWPHDTPWPDDIDRPHPQCVRWPKTFGRYESFPQGKNYVLLAFPRDEPMRWNI